ncbi:MAG TPA: hypothetical protein VFZ11_13850 [Gemmatimonadaceae bacterium]
MCHDRITMASDADLLADALGARDLARVVPLLIDRVEHDPLASAGWFAGDFLRGLLEVPPSFWARQPRLYLRFRECLRAGAIARQALPAAERVHFWTAVLPTADETAAAAADG